jgi:Metallo-beta-lactamase superfamily
MAERTGSDDVLSEVIPGILAWSGPHPRIGVIVHSHYLAEQRIAIDPIGVDGLVPALERAGGVERVVLTNRHHLRGAEEIVAAFGAPLLCPRTGLHEFEAPDRPKVSGYDWGEEIAAGVTAHEVGALSPDEGALHIAVGPGALAFADTVIADSQGLGFVPDFLMDEPEETKRGIVAAVRGLLDLDFDVLLMAHGEPIAVGGKQALRSFVDSPRTAGIG